MPAIEYVRARIDSDIKSEAATVLASMNLTISDLCRMAVTKVAYEKCLPFSFEIPNQETEAAFNAVGKGEELHYAKDAADMFKQLGI